MFELKNRQAPDEIRLQQQVLLKGSVIGLLGEIPPMIMILTSSRQVVYCNKSFSAYIGGSKEIDQTGWRPGEVLHCIYAEGSRSGCGGSTFCKYCGFFQALTALDKGARSVTHECYVQTREGKTLNLSVNATSFEQGGYRYIFCVVDNLENIGFRQLYENMFMNEIRQKLTDIRMLMKEMTSLQNPQYLPLLKSQLIQMEEAMQLFELLQKIEKEQSLYGRHEWFAAKPLVDEVIISLFLNSEFRKRNVKKSIPDIKIYSDRGLLFHVLKALLKNAMEVENNSREIQISVIDSTSTLSFKIKNPTPMNESRQKVVFARFAEPKSDGSGLGSYLAKKIVTGGLNGKISFVSNEEKGTVFTVRLPKIITDNNSALA